MDSKLGLVVVIPDGDEGRRSFDKLVKAAEDLFSQRGYRNTTIKDIVQSAGLSVGAFYIYFRSKYQLYVYIMQNFARRLQSYLDSRAGKITGDAIERQVEYQYAQRYVPALVKSHALPDGMDPLIWSFINMGIGNFIGIKVLAEDDAGPEQMDKIRQTLRILLQSGLEKRTQD